MLETIIVFLSIIADQLTKIWAAETLTNTVLPVIPGVLNFHFTQNTGAAFGMLGSLTPILAAVSGGLAVGMSIFLAKTRKTSSLLYRIALSLIIGGAIGNFIDRVFAGSVVDFIEFDFVNFAIFNVADICVTIGAVLLGVYLLFFYDKDRLRQAKTDEVKDIPNLVAENAETKDITEVEEIPNSIAEKIETTVEEIPGGGE